MQQLVSTSPRNHWTYLIAALLAAGVFLSLPTLSYVHDRLSTADNTAHFRPGKNLERPHERHAVVATAIRIVVTAPGDDPASLVTGPTPPALRLSVRPSQAPRAPPVC